MSYRPLPLSWLLPLALTLSACARSHGDDGGPACPPGAHCVDGGPSVCPCTLPPPGCQYTGPGCCAGLTCEGSDGGTMTSCGFAAGSFPTFDRSCSTASDCAIADHETDCCGGMHAMGIAATEVDRFQRAQSCGMDASCGCHSETVTADDGTANGDGGRTPRLLCASGICTTTFGQ